MNKRSTPRAASTSKNQGKRQGTWREYIQLSSQTPFSDGVLVGDTFYLAGRIGVDAAGKRVPDDIETEAHNVMKSVATVLRAVGMKMEDLVYVQVFCSDVSLWQQFNDIYCSYFKGRNLPARAFVGSGKLLLNAHFEVQGIAVRSPVA